MYQNFNIKYIKKIKGLGSFYNHFKGSLALLVYP